MCRPKITVTTKGFTMKEENQWQFGITHIATLRRFRNRDSGTWAVNMEIKRTSHPAPSALSTQTSPGSLMRHKHDHSRSALVSRVCEA